MKITEGFWVGLAVGTILGILVNVFLIWGGNPKGVYQGINDNKKEITEMKVLAKDNRYLIKGLTLEVIQ